jgi:hypothetical protein
VGTWFRIRDADNFIKLLSQHEFVRALELSNRVQDHCRHRGEAMTTQQSVEVVAKLELYLARKGFLLLGIPDGD